MLLPLPPLPVLKALLDSVLLHVLLDTPPPPAQFLGLPQALMLSTDTVLITPKGSPAPCVTPTQHLSQGNSLLW